MLFYFQKIILYACRTYYGLGNNSTLWPSYSAANYFSLSSIYFYCINGKLQQSSSDKNYPYQLLWILIKSFVSSWKTIYIPTSKTFHCSTIKKYHFSLNLQYIPINKIIGSFVVLLQFLERQTFFKWSHWSTTLCLQKKKNLFQKKINVSYLTEGKQYHRKKAS